MMNKLVILVRFNSGLSLKSYLLLLSNEVIIQNKVNLQNKGDTNNSFYHIKVLKKGKKNPNYP